MASYLKILPARPAPDANISHGAKAEGSDGTITAGKYALCVVAWYGDGDESKLLNAASVLGDINAIAVIGPQHILVNWTAPQRLGKDAQDVHHYAIYLQSKSSVGDAYNPRIPGVKVAVSGYTDGNIPPWLTSAIIIDEASLTSDVAAAILNADGDVGIYYIAGDHRVSLGAGSANVTVSGSAGGLDDGAKTVTWVDVVWGYKQGSRSAGIYTIVRVSNTVTTGITGTLNYKQGPGTFSQLSASPSTYHSWSDSSGGLQYIALNPVIHIQPTARNPYYESSDGMMLPASYGTDVTFSHLQVTITGISCTAWEYAYLIHLMRYGVLLSIEDWNDRIGSGVTVAGDGYVGYANGVLVSASYMGDIGKNRDSAFTLVFQIESENE